MENLKSLQRILKRERNARKMAEQIIEEKSRELFHANQQLKDLNNSLEDQIAERTIELRKRVIDLKNANKYKSEFLANMSHELRTPLNSILILANILGENMEQNLNRKQVEFAQIIQNAGKDLLTLINNILDLAKIEAGKVDLVEEEVELLKLKQHLHNIYDELSYKEKIDFAVNINDNVPEKIFVDEQKLLQILRNLVSNAFKFTEPDGSVQIVVELVEPAAKELKQLRFSVMDTGIGIEPDKQELIFEAFQQADGSTSRKYGGTGLGLSICNQLALMLGGRITLESVVGKGSTFSLEFPLKRNPEDVNLSAGAQATSYAEDISQRAAGLEVAIDFKYADGKVESNSVKPEPVVSNNALTKRRLLAKQLKGKNILIVDDEQRNIYALESLLDSFDVNITIARNGREALQQLASHPEIDVILMDIMMPVMDGYEAMRIIREIPGNESLPIIALTAKAMKGDRELAIDAGASDYVSKPIDIAVFFKTLGDFLKLPEN